MMSAAEIYLEQASRTPKDQRTKEEHVAMLIREPGSVSFYNNGSATLSKFDVREDLDLLLSMVDDESRQRSTSSNERTSRIQILQNKRKHQAEAAASSSSAMGQSRPTPLKRSRLRAKLSQASKSLNAVRTTHVNLVAKVQANKEELNAVKCRVCSSKHDLELMGEQRHKLLEEYTLLSVQHAHELEEVVARNTDLGKTNAELRKIVLGVCSSAQDSDSNAKSMSGQSGSVPGDNLEEAAAGAGAAATAAAASVTEPTVATEVELAGNHKDEDKDKAPTEKQSVSMTAADERIPFVILEKWMAQQSTAASNLEQKLVDLSVKMKETRAILDKRVAADSFDVSSALHHLTEHEEQRAIDLEASMTEQDQMKANLESTNNELQDVVQAIVHCHNRIVELEGKLWQVQGDVEKTMESLAKEKDKRSVMNKTMAELAEDARRSERNVQSHADVVRELGERQLLCANSQVGGLAHEVRLAEAEVKSLQRQYNSVRAQLAAVDRSVMDARQQLYVMDQTVHRTDRAQLKSLQIMNKVWTSADNITLEIQECERSLEEMKEERHSAPDFSSLGRVVADAEQALEAGQTSRAAALIESIDLPLEMDEEVDDDGIEEEEEEEDDEDDSDDDDEDEDDDDEEEEEYERDDDDDDEEEEQEEEDGNGEEDDDDRVASHRISSAADLDDDDEQAEQRAGRMLQVPRAALLRKHQQGLEDGEEQDREEEQDEQGDVSDDDIARQRAKGKGFVVPLRATDVHASPQLEEMALTGDDGADVDADADDDDVADADEADYDGATAVAAVAAAAAAAAVARQEDDDDAALIGEAEEDEDDVNEEGEEEDVLEDGADDDEEEQEEEEDDDGDDMDQ